MATESEGNPGNPGPECSVADWAGVMREGMGQGHSGTLGLHHHCWVHTSVPVGLGGALEFACLINSSESDVPGPGAAL